MSSPEDLDERERSLKAKLSKDPRLWGDTITLGMVTRLDALTAQIWVDWISGERELPETTGLTKDQKPWPPDTVKGMLLAQIPLHFDVSCLSMKKWRRVLRLGDFWTWIAVLKHWASQGSGLRVTELLLMETRGLRTVCPEMFHGEIDAFLGQLEGQQSLHRGRAEIREFLRGGSGGRGLGLADDSLEPNLREDLSLLFHYTTSLLDRSKLVQVLGFLCGMGEPEVCAIAETLKTGRPCGSRPLLVMGVHRTGSFGRRRIVFAREFEGSRRWALGVCVDGGRYEVAVRF